MNRQKKLPKTQEKNEKVDELLDKLNVEFDPEKRKDLAIEIQQLIMNDAATVFFGCQEG